jgi:hypothetical protein
LGEQLAVPAPDIATLRAIYRRRRSTLFEHQTWAISYLGMRRLQASDGMMLMGLLTDVVRSGVFGDHLLATTRRILYEHRIIIPGRRRFSELAGEAATTVERPALSQSTLSNCFLSSVAWTKHYDDHAGHGNCCADEVPGGRTIPVNQPEPSDGDTNVNATVCRIDTASRGRMQRQ